MAKAEKVQKTVKNFFKVTKVFFKWKEKEEEEE